MVEIFNEKNCEKLRGKPKLFLIHTTDNGSTEDSVRPINSREIEVGALHFNIALHCRCVIEFIGFHCIVVLRNFTQTWKFDYVAGKLVNLNAVEIQDTFFPEFS